MDDEENTQLRESLICQADAAFLTITDQANDLLDAVKFYMDSTPSMSRSDLIKSDELVIVVKDIARLIKQAGLEIERWKREEERIVSRIGFEIQCLNELYVTMEVLMLFLERESIPLTCFSMGLVSQSHSDLLRCNSLL